MIHKGYTSLELLPVSGRGQKRPTYLKLRYLSYEIINDHCLYFALVYSDSVLSQSNETKVHLRSEDSSPVVGNMAQSLFALLQYQSRYGRIVRDKLSTRLSSVRGNRIHGS